jgi:hypothetical protein
MFAALIPTLTTGLFVLFVLVLISAVVSSLSRAFGDLEKDPETSQTFLSSALLNQIRLLGERYGSTPFDQRNERDN